jgi:hyperosmotically inducible periplasmic protein
MLTRTVCAFALASIAGIGHAQNSANRSALPPGGLDKLAKEVRHELVLLPYYGVFDNLAFRIDGSTVTLLGQVTRPVTKDDAGKAVQRVEGVTRVDNQIQVLPLSSMDDQIRRATFRAIYSSAGFEKYAYQAVPPIHIIVANGQVTLEGVVGNQMDKIVAGTRANTVPGVFSVTNNLRVDNQ